MNQNPPKRKIGRPSLPEDARGKNRVIRMPEDLWQFCKRSHPKGAAAFIKELAEREYLKSRIL